MKNQLRIFSNSLYDRFFDVCTKNYAGGFITFLKPLVHLMKVPCGDEFLESTGKFRGSSQSLFFSPFFSEKTHTKKHLDFWGGVQGL